VIACASPDLQKGRPSWPGRATIGGAVGNPQLDQSGPDSIPAYRTASEVLHPDTTTTDEPIPKVKIEAQLRATRARLTRLIESRPEAAPTNP